jgi:hypothetical protein
MCLQKTRNFMRNQSSWLLFNFPLDKNGIMFFAYDIFLEIKPRNEQNKTVVPSNKELPPEFGSRGIQEPYHKIIVVPMTGTPQMRGSYSRYGPAWGSVPPSARL